MFHSITRKLNRIRLIFLFALLPLSAISQNYTSYYTGNMNDTMTYPTGGICIMGGATEDDNAMKWFLQRANGGDILVLRTSGSNGYNAYLYSSLGVPVHSVETIVCNNPSASNDPYVLQKIQQAEAIWFAGGDQWTYISYWRNTPVDSLINLGIQQRHIVIGGTSAGMAIQGRYYFSAQNGTVTSATALANPFDNLVTVDSTLFLHHSTLSDVMTDTHFDNPDRRGRLSAFLARIYSDYGVFAKAIACDEYTAVCIDTLGMARVFGDYPTNDDNAYFIQSNCALSNQSPENCSSGNPLTWNLGGEALKVYQVKGTPTGQYSFDLNNWQSGSGGTWLNWSANNGLFNSQNGNAVNCGPLAAFDEHPVDNIMIFPNPVGTDGSLTFQHVSEKNHPFEIEIYDALGRKISFEIMNNSPENFRIRMKNVSKGLYLAHLRFSNNMVLGKKFWIE